MGMIWATLGMVWATFGQHFYVQILGADSWLADPTEPNLAIMNAGEKPENLPATPAILEGYSPDLT